MLTSFIGRVARTVPSRVALLCVVALIHGGAIGRAQIRIADGPVPSPWSVVDIGAPAIGGAASYTGGVFTIAAAGSDIWGASDAFTYTAQPATGDLQIVARVTSLQNTSAFAKAGVMLRAGLTADAAEVLLDAKPDGSVEFMQRVSTGGATTFIAGTPVGLPAWLRLVRSASLVTASVSGNGTTWTTLGTASASSAMTDAGLAVTSHAPATATTAVVDNVTVSATQVAPPPATPTAPSPSDQAVTASSSPTLTWSAPGATSYDVAFGTTTPPPVVGSGLLVPSYTPASPAAGTTYYWQVIARSAAGASASPIWRLSSTGSPSSVVDVWLTTPDMANLLSEQSALPWAPDAGGSIQTIDVDDTTRYQQMDGVGAAMTDTSAWLMSTVLTPAIRTQLMTQFFDWRTGIGLGYLRVPIGASDFALTPYTYDDVPAGQTDTALSAFSTAHDQAYILPMLTQARQINPALGLIATPWSPPAWMKNGQSLQGGTLRTDSATETALANYFVRFLQDYASAGIPIERITTQNEPTVQDGTYPSMLMDAATEATFISGYLAPALASAQLPTKIVAYDHNWDNTAYGATVLGGAAGPFVTGTGWHCYAGHPDAMSTVHDQFPTKDVLFTECSADTATSGFGRNLRYDMQTLIVGAARNWARTILKWNLALDTANGPHVGGCLNCLGLVTIDRTVSPPVIRYNYDYYTLGHVGKFVPRGAYRVASNTFGTDNIEDVAFANPDGSTVVIVVNTDTSTHPFKIRRSGNSATYTLAAGAAATFILPPATGAGLPPPWIEYEVGGVAAPGTSTLSAGVMTVTGSGADIWGTADAFHFVAQPSSGDVQVIARVASLQNTHPIAKAGVMLRGSLAAGSAHLILDVKPDGGVEFMQRATDGGTTTYLSGMAAGIPEWLRLTKVGATVTAAVSADGVLWTTVGTAAISPGSAALAGLAVSSHTASLTTAAFDHVSISPLTSAITPPNTPAPSSGSANVPRGPRLTWNGAGATSYTVSFGTTSPPPVVVTGLASPPFTPAVLSGGTTFYWQVTAQNNTASATGPVWSFTTSGSAGLPSGSIDQDIGAVGAAGTANVGTGSVTITAAGSDIWGTSDAFHYLAQTISGDGQILAHVTHLDNTSPFAKAGVMMRDSTAANSAHVILDVKPDGSIEFMQRSSAGGVTAYKAGGTLGFPAWLRLLRVGTTVSAAVSSDGVTWTTVGSAVTTATSGFAGYCVTSHASGVATAVFQTAP